MRTCGGSSIWSLRVWRPPQTLTTWPRRSLAPGRFLAGGRSTSTPSPTPCPPRGGCGGGRGWRHQVLSQSQNIYSSHSLSHIYDLVNLNVIYSLKIKGILDRTNLFNRGCIKGLSKIKGYNPKFKANSYHLVSKYILSIRCIFVSNGKFF